MAWVSYARRSLNVTACLNGSANVHARDTYLAFKVPWRHPFKRMETDLGPRADAVNVIRCCSFKITPITIVWRLLTAGSAAGSSAGIIFTHGRFLGFSPRRGDTLHRSRWNLAGRSGAPPCQILPWCHFFENNARRPSTALVRSWVTSARHSVGICRPI